MDLTISGHLHLLFFSDLGHPIPALHLWLDCQFAGQNSLCLDTPTILHPSLRLLNTCQARCPSPCRSGCPGEPRQGRVPGDLHSLHTAGAWGLSSCPEGSGCVLVVCGGVSFPDFTSGGLPCSLGTLALTSEALPPKVGALSTCCLFSLKVAVLLLLNGGDHLSCDICVLPKAPWHLLQVIHWPPCGDKRRARCEWEGAGHRLLFSELREGGRLAPRQG